MKINKLFTFLATVAVTTLFANAEVVPTIDTMSDTWVAIDDLGRTLPIDDQVTAPRKDKFVGVFYYLWHGAHNGPLPPGQGVVPLDQVDPNCPYNNSEILKAPPGERKWGPHGAYHHWGESLYGFYVADDEWVIRHNAQLLADAGVDVIIFDVTNALHYHDIYMNLLRIYADIRAHGGKTPAISFLTNSGHVNVVNALYEQLYSKGLYKDLWFFWKGKPLMMANPEGLSQEMQDFFTLRRSWAWTKDGDGDKWFKDGKDAWPWLDHTPQNYGWHESPDKPEQMVVCSAEHPNSDRGKSFHDGSNPRPLQTEKGLYFAEQWKHALEVDPEFIFVTQWNEWIAMRFVHEDIPFWKEYAGEPLRDPQGIFVDVYNMEYNRDIEPMKGGFGDNYYYQLFSNVRKYKGARPVPETTMLKKSVRDWDAITLAFNDDRGDTFHRNHRGYGPRLGKYVNETGRNDIAVCKVAQAAKNLVFMAECTETLSQPVDSKWMNLWLTIEGSQTPAWHGIQYNVKFDSAKKATLYGYNTGTSSWEKKTTLRGSVKDKQVTLSIPLASLGLEAKDSKTICFKWSDNMQDETNPIDWLTNGDTAPNGRAMYRVSIKE